MKEGLIFANIVLVAIIGMVVIGFAIFGVLSSFGSDITLDRDNWTCTQSGIIEVHHPKQSPTFDRSCTQWTMAPMETAQ